MKLDRSLTAVFVLLLLHNVYAMSIGWHHTIFEQYGFRQAQTAITVEYLLKGGPWFAYETPVFGPPWSIPFEFPLYQWVVALIVFLLGMPIDQAGRWTSVLFFYASLPATDFLLRRCGLSKSQRLPFLMMLLASPIYIFWTRTVMIESCVLFLSILYLALAVDYLKTPGTRVAVLTALTGSLAAMVKLPTFFGFAICSALFLVADRPLATLQTRVALRKHIIFVLCAGIIPALAGYGWSLYAEAERLRNPLAAFLSLRSLSGFTYGTLRQRFSPQLWQVIWSRSISDIVGSNLLILPLVICLPLVRKELRAFSMLAVAVFIGVFMTFTNLHYVHAYYQYANGVFLIAALGFGIAGLIELQGAARVSGLILLGAAVALGLNEYYGGYEKSQESNDTRLGGTASVIQQHTNPDDAVLVYGLEWSPELLYSSHRRGIMVRMPGSPQLQRATVNLGRRKIGAIAVCLLARHNPAVEQSRCRYGLEAAPTYEDAMCAVYLPSPPDAMPPPCSNQQTSSATTPPLANVDLPVAGSGVSGVVLVAGWVLSQTGVREVVLYFDDRPVGTAAVRISRPDVQLAYPQYSDSSNAGFRGTIDLTRETVGPHTLRVELLAGDGRRHNLGSRPLVVTR